MPSRTLPWSRSPGPTSCCGPTWASRSGDTSTTSAPSRSTCFRGSGIVPSRSCVGPTARAEPRTTRSRSPATRRRGSAGSYPGAERWPGCRPRRLQRRRLARLAGQPGIARAAHGPPAGRHPRPARLLVVDIDPPDGAFHAAVERHCSCSKRSKNTVWTVGSRPRGARVTSSCRSNDASTRSTCSGRPRPDDRGHQPAARPRDRRVPQGRPGGTSHARSSRNGPGATIVAPFSPRARPEGTVSFPVVAEDLPDVQPDMFTLTTVPDQLDAAGPRHWGSSSSAGSACPPRCSTRVPDRRAHERRDRRAVVAGRARGVGAPTPSIGASVTFCEVLAGGGGRSRRIEPVPHGAPSRRSLGSAHDPHVARRPARDDRARAATARVPHVCGGAPRARPPRLGSPRPRRPAGPQHRQRRRASPF